MINKSTTHALTAMACAVALAITSLHATADDAASATPAPPPSVPVTAPMTSSQLDSLVAPIALYPDALVAQCLNAATFPDQVSIAQDWLSGHGNLTGTALSSAVNAQPWDPSVKALTQFPSVLSNLAQNLSWTSSLGEAYHNQPTDVMVAVQAMRAKAQAAGTLKSTPQINVVQQSPQTIVIQPANPQVVYVPQYNPAVVYGVPYVVPYYRPVFVAPSPVITFGGGVFIGAGFSAGVGIVGGGGGFHWGFNAWNVNWGGGGGGTVIYNHTTYINNNIWHGNHYTYNGYRPWGPGPHGPWPYGPHPYGPPAPGSARMQHYDNYLAHRYTADGGTPGATMVTARAAPVRGRPAARPCVITTTRWPTAIPRTAATPGGVAATDRWALRARVSAPTATAIAMTQKPHRATSIVATTDVSIPSPAIARIRAGAATARPVARRASAVTPAWRMRACRPSTGVAAAAVEAQPSHHLHSFIRR